MCLHVQCFISWLMLVVGLVSQCLDHRKILLLYKMIMIYLSFIPNTIASVTELLFKRCMTIYGAAGLAKILATHVNPVAMSDLTVILPVISTWHDYFLLLDSLCSFAPVLLSYPTQLFQSSSLMSKHLNVSDSRVQLLVNLLESHPGFSSSRVQHWHWAPRSKHDILTGLWYWIFLSLFYFLCISQSLLWVFLLV